MFCVVLILISHKNQRLILVSAILLCLNAKIFVCEPTMYFMLALPSHNLDYHWIVWHICFLTSKMLDFIFVIIAEIIESETILFGIHYAN